MMDKAFRHDNMPGETAEEALILAHRHYELLHGVGGYSGTIAEKHIDRFIEHTLPDGLTANEFADMIVHRRTFNNSWSGPVGMIRNPDGSWLLFGVARG